MVHHTTSAPPKLRSNILALGPLAPDTLASGPWPQAPGPWPLASGFELLPLGLWPLAYGLWLLAPSSLPLAFGLCSFSLAPRPGLCWTESSYSASFSCSSRIRPGIRNVTTSLHPVSASIIFSFPRAKSPGQSRPLSSPSSGRNRRGKSRLLSSPSYVRNRWGSQNPLSSPSRGSILRER